MTKKQCWRYKCDFCGRVGYSSAYMKRHEIGCTANKDRVCRMPIHEDDAPRNSVVVLAGILKRWGKEDFGMQELRDACENCPACILAAIRCSGIQKYELDEDGENTEPDLKFNFKEELASMWADVNDARAALKGKVQEAGR